MHWQALHTRSFGCGLYCIYNIALIIEMVDATTTVTNLALHFMSGEESCCCEIKCEVNYFFFSCRRSSSSEEHRQLLHSPSVLDPFNVLQVIYFDLTVLDQSWQTRLTRSQFGWSNRVLDHKGKSIQCHMYQGWAVCSSFPFCFVSKVELNYKYASCN